MSNLIQLPVLPLRELVVFPGTTVPVSAGRPGTLKAIQNAVKHSDRKVFAVSQSDNADEVTPERLHTIGTIASIDQLVRTSRGLQFLVHGETRGIALRYAETQQYLEAVLREAEELLPVAPEDAAFVAMQRAVRDRATCTFRSVRYVRPSTASPGLGTLQIGCCSGCWPVSSFWR